MIHEAMAQAGVGPNDTAMIGDTTFDIEMACHASVSAIGVSWGYHPVAALVEAGAHAVIDDYSHLDPALDKLLGGLERAT
jgi:phosphoglycolate phosphatase